jgi:Tol biopolymer transport system component
MTPLPRAAASALFLVAIVLGGSAPAVEDPVFQPGVVSTAAAEVRLAVRPDGRQILWGAIGRRGDPDQQDIWERHLDGRGRWSPPALASFSTDAADFDPAFSPDGRRLFFHSDRPGGFGGTDLYVVAVGPDGHGFGEPENLGPWINSPGDEWAPAPAPWGGLVFASDGWGGFGLHDLFESSWPVSATPPRNLGPAVNGPDEDFDAVATGDGARLLFSSGRMTGDPVRVALYQTRRQTGGWGERRRLAAGCSDFVIGAAIHPEAPDILYYAANCAGGAGRMDIRQTRLPPMPHPGA